MWEAIAQNRRRSLLLIGAMALLLVLLGAAIGAAAGGYAASGGGNGEMRSSVSPPSGEAFENAALTGAALGAAAAGALWFVMLLVAFSAGGGILLRSAGAREVGPLEAPTLVNVVEEMAIASGMSKPPRVYLLDDSRMNAFAVGRKPEDASVAVTAGLLKQLNRDELQGVIAHEIGHIRNLDVRFMTYAGVMLGAVVMISDVFLRSLFYSGRYGGRRRSSSDRGGQGAAILMAVAVVFAILAPILAQLLYFACSRKREYLADASAARYTRYPPGLASALEKISKRPGGRDGKANRVVAPMFTVNPRQAVGGGGIFSTHPPTEKRIAVLKAMAGGAGFGDYEAAWEKVHGGGRVLGSRTLAEDAGPVAVREPSPAPKGGGAAREAVDALARLSGMAVIACSCGMNLKVPPDYAEPALLCPRCGAPHEIPDAGAGATASGLSAEAAEASEAVKAGRDAEPQVYKRKGAGWETFSCESCGANVNLSPSFSVPRTRCPKCRRTIRIE